MEMIHLKFMMLEAAFMNIILLHLPIARIVQINVMNRVVVNSPRAQQPLLTIHQLQIPRILKK